MPLKLSHGMSAWIKDFQKSDAPQFKGKSDKERRDQAIAAYMSAKRDANENYVSHAQRKAVWASRADGGKGHPDNKKKNEAVDEIIESLNEAVKPNDVLVKIQTNRRDPTKKGPALMFDPKDILSSLLKIVSPETKKALAGAYTDNDEIVHNKTDKTMARMKLNMTLSELAKDIEKWTKDNIKQKATNEAVEYDSGWKKSPQDRKDQYGNPVKAKNVPKKLAKMGMKQHDKDDKKKNEGVEEGGLWANIHAKRKRIKNGSSERMRKPGSKGAPTNKDFKDAQESVQHKSFFDLREATKCKTATAKRVAEDMKSAAAELSKYAKGHGGMDKADFQKAAKHMEAGDHKSLHKHISKLDTDPRDKILTTLHKHGNDIKRYGYATEEVEQIDELSKATLGSYAKKATNNARMQQSVGKDFEKQADKSRKPGMKAAALSLADKYKSKSRKREAGVGKAIDRLTKEETEQVDELSQNTLRNYHGKSALDIRKKRDQLNKGTLSTADHKKAQRRVTGINRAANKMEEVEQVDELSNDMLQRYKKKAGAAASDADKKGDVKTGNKRFSGIMKATSKQFKNDLKKESTDAYGKSLEKEKEKRLTPSDSDKLAKIRAMMAKEKKKSAQ